MIKHLILGFGSAGSNAADVLRRADDSAEITVLNAEPHSLYLRLDLESLFFGKTVADLMPRAPEFWLEKKITVVQDRAVHLDPVRHEVRGTSGRTYSYDKLLIAAGALPRVLKVPGRELDGVLHYHTLADAIAIEERHARIHNAVIIGAGILGLEMARAGVHYGWKIALLVRGGFVGSGTVDESGAAIILKSLERAGVQVIFHDEAAAFEGNGKLTHVRTKQGHLLPADIAVICAGVVQATNFLRDTGILTAGRLIVDDKMQTPVPDVYAAGDIAWVRRSAERLVSCNTWNIAGSQGRAAAANMSGQNIPWRDEILYNLDFLFDQELAVIGAWDARHEAGRTMREFHTEHSYHALVTRDGILESAVLLGDRSADRFIRKLIANRARVDGKLERVFAADATPEEFK